jgi:hypothetical protein
MKPFRIALLSLFGLTGCMSMKVEDFADKKPAFAVETYFAGKTKAWGIFQDRFGNLKRQFTVDLDGRMDGDQFVLTEDFVYDDGETEQRIWRIKRLDAHHYEGRAAGVVGSAAGLVYGSALNWQYDFDLKVGDSTWRVAFDDWMFQQDDDVMVNRARISKLGIDLGEVSIFFRKK